MSDPIVGAIIAAMAPRLELFAFRYRDPRTGKWVKARYVAERHEIAARFAEWEIVALAEVRDVNPDARYFTPHRREAGNLGPVIELAASKSPRRVAIAGDAS